MTKRKLLGLKLINGPVLPTKFCLCDRTFTLCMIVDNQPTCHPLHKQVVVVLLTGCPKHPDDVGVVEETHHANLLS